MIWICPLWKPVAKSRGNLVEKRDCVGLLLVDMIISGWMTFLMFQQVTSPWWVFMFSYVTTNSICPGTDVLQCGFNGRHSEPSKVYFILGVGSDAVDLIGLATGVPVDIPG